MIVKFKTCKSSLLEDWERAMQKEMQGVSSLDFYRHSDYIGTVAIEMDNVVDYEVGQVYVNQQVHECVYAKLGIEDDKYTSDLIITGDEFQELLLKLNNKKVRTAQEILNEL